MMFKAAVAPEDYEMSAADPGDAMAPADIGAPDPFPMKMAKTIARSKSYASLSKMSDMDCELKSIGESIARPRSGGRRVNLFWTGGFDSTSQLIRHVRQGDTVRPIYMRHSPASDKCKFEEAAKKKIIERLGKNASLLPAVTWDYEQLTSTVEGARLSNTLHELADSVLVSHQYSALRFCRDVTGFTNPDDFGQSAIEVCVVTHDELWERLLNADKNGPIWKFFKGFTFPLLNESKRDLWNSMSEEDRDILRMTYCCESPSNDGQSCIAIGRDFDARCCPCKRRHEGLV